MFVLSFPCWLSFLLLTRPLAQEDSYTEALSTIITRDFFPNLSHIHATNAYLTALTNNDPELLSASIRRLAALAQEKGESGREAEGSSSKDEVEAGHARRRELENMGTPYISIPGGRANLRTPVGARGWDTPIMHADEGSTQRKAESGGFDELEDERGSTPGPSQYHKKQRTALPQNRVRDDLTLDAFQRNYTSEDNASFVQIVDEENKRRREDRWAWAWDAERKADQRRLEGEEKRKMILDVATSGGWMINGEGRRLIGGLAEGGAARVEMASKEKRQLIEASSDGTITADIPSNPRASEADTVALVPHALSSGSTALVSSGTADSGANSPPSGLTEIPIQADHPLHKALLDAGLPATALLSLQDGLIVPSRDTASGEGEGRGRGDGDKERRNLSEVAVLGSEGRDHVALGGSGAEQWGYKVSPGHIQVGSTSLCDRHAIISSSPRTRTLIHTLNCEVSLRSP